MHSKQRRIKLIIDLDRLGEVLKDLQINKCVIYNDFDVDTADTIVEVEETPELFKKLTLNDGIQEWDFCDEEEPQEIKKENNLKPIKEIVFEEYDKTETPEKRKFNNFNDAATYVEACWLLSKKSPSIIFESSLFNKELETYYNIVASSDVTVEHALLTMILQNYYSQVDYDEAYEDIIKKLKDEWKNLNQHPSLASLSKIWK